MGEKIVRLPHVAPPPLSEMDRRRLRRLADHGVPVHFGAYAPDPDTDYDAGFREGYRLGELAGRRAAEGLRRPLVSWGERRAHVTGLGFIVSAVALALIVAVIGWL